MAQSPEARDYDRKGYKTHPAERFVNRLKPYRRVAIRTARKFFAFVRLAAMLSLLNVTGNTT